MENKDGPLTERFARIIDEMRDEEQENLLIKGSDNESSKPSLSPYRAHQIL